MPRSRSAPTSSSPFPRSRFRTASFACCSPSNCIARGRSSPAIRITGNDSKLRSMSVIYLASRSPRRRELLAQIGVRFEPLMFRDGARRDPDTDETVHPGELPEDYVLRVTRQKARSAWERVLMRRGIRRMPVLAADTTVAQAGEIFGKPAGRDDARRMLAARAGTRHQVLTAVAVTMAEGIELA